MEFRKLIKYSLMIGLVPFCTNLSFSQVEEKFAGQAPAKEVDTRSKQIDTINKKKFFFEKDGITFMADFKTARLNDVIRENDSTFTAFIKAENYPINSSPWYAFQVISKTSKTIHIILSYKDSKHRYFPKVSKNGHDWKPMDSSLVSYINPGQKKFGAESMAEKAVLKINIATDTTWIAAQEIVSSDDVREWKANLALKNRITLGTVGNSTNGKVVPYFSFGKEKKNKPVVVVLSRQHPPEVTGYFAMQKFVEGLLEHKSIARRYRKKFVTYVFPIMNPDGVDNGHWRHNAGGIDLNRDWKHQNQPEVKQVNTFLENKLKQNESAVIFAIDFHSTWDDIYYTNSNTKPTNYPGLMDQVLKKLEEKLNAGPLNIRASEVNEPFVSKGYFYVHYNAEAVTYEVGDNTSREIILNKGKLAAQSLLEALLKK